MMEAVILYFLQTAAAANIPNNLLHLQRLPLFDVTVLVQKPNGGSAA